MLVKRASPEQPSNADLLSKPLPVGKGGDCDSQTIEEEVRSLLGTGGEVSKDLLRACNG